MLSLAKEELVAEVYSNVNDLWEVVLVRTLFSRHFAYGLQKYLGPSGK